MIKTLTRHGNSYALIIDKAVMELLHIAPETELEISTDGSALIVAPAKSQERKKRFRKALDRSNHKFAKGLKKLAE